MNCPATDRRTEQRPRRMAAANAKEEYVPDAEAPEGGGSALLNMLPWPFSHLSSRSVRMGILAIAIMLNS